VNIVGLQFVAECGCRLHPAVNRTYGSKGRSHLVGDFKSETGEELASPETREANALAGKV
jgi:hypothetical protein